jgi:hypothetical protein
VCKAINHTLAILVFLGCGASALAADINLNGIVGSKALLVIDGGKPRWLAVGESSPARQRCSNWVASAKH